MPTIPKAESHLCASKWREKRDKERQREWARGEALRRGCETAHNLHAACSLVHSACTHFVSATYNRGLTGSGYILCNWSNIPFPRSMFAQYNCRRRTHENQHTPIHTHMEEQKHAWEHTMENYAKLEDNSRLCWTKLGHRLLTRYETRFVLFRYRAVQYYCCW